MTDEELISIWHRTSAPPVAGNAEDLSDREMDKELKKFDKAIRNRDIRENVSALIVMVFFSVIVFWVEPLVSKVASLLVITWAGFTIWITFWAKRMRVKDASLPLLEYLQLYRVYVARQKSLLDNILWWYVLPAWACIILFSLGYNSWKAMVAGTLMGIFTFWLNKYASRQYFKPLLHNLDKEIKSLES